MRIVVALICILMCISCKEPKVIYVKSQLKSSNDGSSTPSMEVREKGAKDWVLLSEKIDGFEYEEGYNYVLDITVEKVKEAAANTSPFKYTLVKVLSKTKDETVAKNSKGMLEGRFKLVQVKDVKLETDTNTYIVFSNDLKKASGYAGCNRFYSLYELSGSTITFKPVVATKMYCMDKMELEKKTFQALSAVHTFELENDVLILQDKTGAQLIKAVKE